MSYMTSLEEICVECVAPMAMRTDTEGRFPREAMTAFGGSGLLGLVSAESVGGLGQNLRAASEVIRRVARDCQSTAMVLCMHYVATIVIETYGDERSRRAITSGRHLTTLAFSETGSRSHFWVAMGTAHTDGDAVLLNANKSWVTSAGEADSYVWSSKPLAAEGLSTLWLIDARAAGLSQAGKFDGLGLRGNASTPVTAKDVRIARTQRLGEDGKGFEAMMSIVLPWFVTLSAACSTGLCEGVLARTIAHVKQTHHQYADTSLADLPTIRAYLARAQIQTDMLKSLLQDTLLAIESARADSMLRVLQIKAAGAESALSVTETCMRVCGGAAFRREAGIERFFRDARAANVMAPTTDVLYDFIGKLITDLPLF